MCTAATYQTADFYFGRTLDYEFSYGDEVVILPRNYPLTFRHAETPATRYAMISMAHVADGYPLYYDACNEKGLCMAGLNFVGNAAYAAAEPGHLNVAQFELIPWVLRQCATLAEARQLLEGTNLVGTPFAAQFPAAQLHWLIADRSGALTLESMADGMHIWENPVGVLTNNPPFPVQLLLLNNYMGVTAQAPENRFSDRIALKPYSRGMGGMGLPGDLSSASRFVRVAFTKLNAVSGTAMLIGAVLLALLAVIAAVRMPKDRDSGKFDIRRTFGRLWHNRRWRYGVVAQFFYVGVQTGVWSFTIRLAMDRLGMAEKDASLIFLYSIVAFTLFRFLFTWLMGYVRPVKLLRVAAVAAIGCTLGVIYGTGWASVWALVGISACMSLMFPTIYGIALEGVTGDDAKLAASGLIMAILGGALITPLQAMVSDSAGIGSSFWVPAACFVCVLAYSLMSDKLCITHNE